MSADNERGLADLITSAFINRNPRLSAVGGVRIFDNAL
jgi:hypothetical protein